jgi:2-amino-4-hydroxy-6-hydroxymethyldihydropteridine diphosphokinase
VGVTDQPPFFNAVLRLSTRLAPLELLHRLQRIESQVFDRTRLLRWGPRTMDLDLLLYGSEVVSDDELIIPHPRMVERRFVLEPLCALAPDLIHPVLGRSMAELLAALPEGETVVQI